MIWLSSNMLEFHSSNLGLKSADKYSLPSKKMHKESLISGRQ